MTLLAWVGLAAALVWLALLLDSPKASSATGDIQSIEFDLLAQTRAAALTYVSSSAAAVDAFHNPVTNKDILAVATQRCEQGFFDGAFIDFWDVTNPAIPTRVGRFDPENVITRRATGSTCRARRACSATTSPSRRGCRPQGARRQ